MRTMNATTIITDNRQEYYQKRFEYLSDRPIGDIANDYIESLTQATESVSKLSMTLEKLSQNLNNE